MLTAVMIVVLAALAYSGASLWLWTVAIALWLAAAAAPLWLAVTFAVVAIIFNFPALRTRLVSQPMLMLIRKMHLMPHISETERAALKAGDVWVEKELFSGKPDFNRLRAEIYPHLSAHEQAFLDGPVEELCSMVRDWDVWKSRELPPEAWKFIKAKGFLGMIIPRQYGGLGFSASAHSAVIQKLNSRSIPLAITAMVPNSLGPAELLIHHGTREQKDYYLPRLARGEEIPCFALTEPEAGSDASSIRSHGVVFRGGDGKLYIRLNWNKRWITLSMISTVMGLAFRLYDPENLLGHGTQEIGITCALIPTHTSGITVDRRHDPLGVPFYNSPTQGRDVVVPIDSIIGGARQAGRGWTLLMESLAAGRGISLPAQACGEIKMIARVSSAHAALRSQFGLPIGKFEGIATPLAQIAGLSYLTEASRKYICGALDRGIRPAIVTAIAKYHFTEIARRLVNYGMDILGGQGISLGPKNLIAHYYLGTPISITVEGANIMTRSLIIFGQGALRAHPYAFREVEAVESRNVRAFDHLIWKHFGHVVRNFTRSVLLSLTRGYLAFNAGAGEHARYYRKLAWASATFALLVDLSMMSQGGSLKTREKLTGRLVDVLSWMLLATATLRRFDAEGRRNVDLPYFHCAMNHCFYRIQVALQAIYANFPPGPLGLVFRGPIRWYSAINPIGRAPRDHEDIELAQLFQKPGAQRARLFDGIYLPEDNPAEAITRLEEALEAVARTAPIRAKIRKAIHEKRLLKPPREASALFEHALRGRIITDPEHHALLAAERLRVEVIQVDDFGPQEYTQRAAAA